MAKKGKIPKELSDTDMLKGYEADETIAELLEEQENKKIKATAIKNKSVDESINLAGITLKTAFLEDLGKALLAQKIELAQEGIDKYQYKVKREGKSIIIIPKIN